MRNIALVVFIEFPPPHVHIDEQMNIEKADFHVIDYPKC